MGVQSVENTDEITVQEQQSKDRFIGFTASPK